MSADELEATLVELYRSARASLEEGGGIGESDLRKDDSGVSMTAIWARVSDAIKDIRGYGRARKEIDKPYILLVRPRCQACRSGFDATHFWHTAKLSDLKPEREIT